MEKAPDAFRTISEVAQELDVPQHVLRFWESRFREIKPMKRGGGRRYYRPDDLDLLRGIRHLLYGEGYTIRGVQRLLREQGVRFVRRSRSTGRPRRMSRPSKPRRTSAPMRCGRRRCAAPMTASGRRGSHPRRRLRRPFWRPSPASRAPTRRNCRPRSRT